MQLVIDTREKELINTLKDQLTFDIQSLDIGDIRFEKDGEPILIIERKTVGDLRASICDSRHREQKKRLLSTTPRERLMYIVEGSLDFPLKAQMGGFPVSTLISSIINTQLRDGIKVYKTGSIKETAQFIIALHSKFNKELANLFAPQEGASPEEYCATLKTQKKANMTPHVWLIAQLSLIPQVTEKIAAEILKVYPNLPKLIKGCEEKGEKFVADIKYGLKSGKERRIGDKISGRIYHFLFDFSQSEAEL